MEIIEHTGEPSLQEKGRALQKQFDDYNLVAQERMLAEPIREAACQLPTESWAEAAGVNLGTLNEQITAEIAGLAEIEAELMEPFGFGLDDEDQFYQQIQKYEKQTNLKIISEPLRQQVEYELLNSEKLIEKSHKNMDQLKILGTSYLIPEQNAINEQIYLVKDNIEQENEQIFSDAIFYENLLKADANEMGNLEELKKLQGIKEKELKIKKNYDGIETKNKVLDETTVFKKIVGFIEPVKFNYDDEKVLAVKNALFGSE